MKKLVCLVLFAAACTESGDAEFEQAASNVEGIYAISAYTRNEAACEPGGESLLAQDRFAVAVQQEFFGHRVLMIISCASAADCREKLADIRAQEPYVLDFQFAVERVGVNGELNGNGTSTGFGMGGTCVDGEITATNLQLTGASLRIEQKITISDPYPADDGFCTTELARKHAAGNECSQMESLSGELLEVL